jgi:hypothetical protein
LPASFAHAVEFLATCELPAVRLHAARTLGNPRRFGSIRPLRDAAERDMFARDVRELFLSPYAQAFRTGRLRGDAAAVMGRVLSGNASVALDSLIARGCTEPGRAVDRVLRGMLQRAHERGFFYEPHQEPEAARFAGRTQEACFLRVTACYARYLLAFGRGRDPRVRRAFDWIGEHQEADGTWRPSAAAGCRDDTESYFLTRAVAEAFAELPVNAVRRWATARRQLAAGWTERILANCEAPDAVMTEPILAPDPRGPHRAAATMVVPDEMKRRLLYFPLEDLWLAIRLGANPRHAHLAPWVRWLESTQNSDGAWRLRNPGLRERLLLSDPNGRLRAEALFLTDEWITLRAAQILRVARRPTRARAAEAVAVA